MVNRKARALMILKDVKSKDIAERHGVTRTWISLVLGGRKSDRIRKAIADALDVKVEELWIGEGTSQWVPRRDKKTAA